LNNDWTKDVVAEKMKRLKDVIMGLKNGNGPDILLLQEVENINVLEQLRKNYLQKAGYQKSILIEGPDVRGIDTAMLSRLPLVGKPKLHILNLKNPAHKKQRPTRGILQATFELPHGQKLTMFSVHLPSQGGPTILRKQALAILEKITTKLPKDRLIVIGGDFNITHNEDYKNKLLDTYIAKHFYISHRIGLFNEKGTEVYRGHWSFLDMLMFSKNMFPRDVKKGWVFMPESLRIPKHSIYQVSRFYSPNRFNPKSGGGVSDHYPVAVDLKYKSE
jgi:endonuclease/exonuclease/phosphatase family metal-dependent hydrolase